MGTVKLDIDRRCKLLEIQERIDTVMFLTKIRVSRIRALHTRKGWHVYIDLTNKLSDMEVVALQAILGSDWKREALNWRRAHRKECKNWNVLFFEKRDILTNKVLSCEKA